MTNDLMARAIRQEAAKFELLLCMAELMVGRGWPDAMTRERLGAYIKELRDASVPLPEPDPTRQHDLVRKSVTAVAIDTDWRHKKTGNIYRVVGGCRIEDANKLAVLYARDGVVWCRPSEEFLDGRFEAL